MSRFLFTDDNPDGYKLEEILSAIRNEVIQRASKIMDDRRPEATAVLNNNIRILSLLAEGIEIAEDSSKRLNQSFGPHKTDSVRIGTA